MADDIGYEAFGAYGSQQYSTPTVDRLASAGVRFTHAYSTPVCTPSRVEVLTGKSNIRNYVDFGTLAPGQYTFANLFKDAGYASAIAGKWQLHGGTNVEGTLPADAGFDTYCLWHTGMTKRPRYWTPSIERDGQLMDLPQGAYGPDVFADFLIEFMEDNRDRPFFVYYPMVLAHNPFLPTPSSVNRESREQQANFTDMVSYMDSNVGRIVAAVDRLGLGERTVVIFTSDNGSPRRIRSVLNDRRIRGGKNTTLDTGNHVPLIVYAPGTGDGGRVVDDLVSLSDFLPTLADIIGAKLPSNLEIDGRSFWPRILGQPGDPREWIFTYFIRRPYSDDPVRRAEVRFAQDRRFKLYGDGRFYDLTKDIREKDPIPAGEGGPDATAARRTLELALSSFPVHGELLPKRMQHR